MPRLDREWPHLYENILDDLMEHGPLVFQLGQLRIQAQIVAQQLPPNWIPHHLRPQPPSPLLRILRWMAYLCMCLISFILITTSTAILYHYEAETATPNVLLAFSLVLAISISCAVKFLPTLMP
jgi:hypothetical protein